MGGLVRISTGKAIQWRAPGDSANRRTPKTEKLLSSSPSQKSAPKISRSIRFFPIKMFRGDPVLVREFRFPAWFLLPCSFPLGQCPGFFLLPFSTLSRRDSVCLVKTPLVFSAPSIEDSKRPSRRRGDAQPMELLHASLKRTWSAISGVFWHSLSVAPSSPDSTGNGIRFSNGGLKLVATEIRCLDLPLEGHKLSQKTMQTLSSCMCLSLYPPTRFIYSLSTGGASEHRNYLDVDAGLLPSVLVQHSVYACSLAFSYLAMQSQRDHIRGLDPRTPE